jgi:hypothetical protein
MQWGPGHTAVVAMMIDSEPYALTYRRTGEVMIRHLTTSGFTMTFASRSGFWKNNVTHVVLLDLAGRPYLARYSGLDGSAFIHHVRDGGTGVDPVCRVPPPGLGGLSILGVGAAAIGRVSLPTAGPPAQDLYFYNALKQTLSITPLTPH